MGKRHFGILATLLAGAIVAVCAGAPMAADQPAPQIAVYFSPHGGCTDAIVRELDAAKETVIVQAYEFTSAPIAWSTWRGVTVCRGLEAECARAASGFLLCEERADARLIATVAVIECNGSAIYLHLWRRISVTMQLPSSAISRTGAAIFNLIRRKPMCMEKTTSEKVSDTAKSAGKKVKWAAQDAGKAVGDAAKATGKAVSNAAKATGRAAEDAIKK